jgi:NAD+ synthase
MNKNLKDLLKIDHQREKDRIILFVKEKLKQFKKDGAVLGLSGGLDSSTCAYLLVEALGKNNVLGFLLPERDSSAVNLEHARMVAKNLGIKTTEINISKMLDEMGVYKIGPKELKTEKDVEGFKRMQKLAKKLMGAGEHFLFKRLSLIYGTEEMPLLLRPYGGELHKVTAFSFTKVRMRMLHLYYNAWLHNYAVVGTLDKSEFSIGLFDLHGDGACDMAILRHLYKSQIREMAIGIGVPSEIIQKKSSGDLYGNEPWEEAMGMTYEQLDQVLLGLEKGYPDEELAQIVGAEGIESIKRGREVSKLLRSLPLALD